jgi:hypothetical protein
LPEDRRLVVVEIMDGLFARVHGVYNDVVLSNSTSQFQVTVGDGTVRVGGRDKLRTDFGGEWGTP